jgi:hypothetical protein
VTDTKKLWLTALFIASTLAGFFLLWGWLYDRFHQSWVVMVVFSAIWTVANWFFWRRVNEAKGKS